MENRKHLIILHYIPSIDRDSGGVGVYMQLLAKSLGQHVNLHIITHKGRNSLSIENAEVHFISSSVLCGMKKEWVELLDAIHPDIVHCNSCWWPGSAFAQKWAEQYGYKVVLTPHGMLEPWIMDRHYWTRKFPALMLYQKTAIRNAICLHATAESEKADLLELGWNNKVEVIPNAVDVGDIKLKDSWKRRRRILFMGRIHVTKGINYFIEAVAQLKKYLDGYEINIAGAGERLYINELQQQAARLGIGNLVHFVGAVYGEQKWRFYRDADLFVLPTHSENFGIVVAEALASGTPVITTKGAPWEDLNTYHCGWWIPIGTEPLVNALREFLACKDDELMQMGLNGRKLVKEKYDSTIVAQKFMELYSKLLNL